jgi:hypothetical protein
MSDKRIIKEYDKPLPQNIEGLQKALNGVSKVVGVQHRLSESFVLHFLGHFADTPLSPDDNLSKSNWTHHVYFAIRSAAKALYLGCTFETMGRLDAVIDTLDDYPGIILVAEWESDSSSIFGKDNELDKLWNGTHRNQNADGFLLTYCNIEKLHEFTKQVVEYWQDKKSERENPPSLFLIVIAYKQEKRAQKFLLIRSLEITSSTIFLWHDLTFVTDDEYLEAIQNQ